MYKVVLIDDESIIVEGLKKVVNWKKYGCTVAATAFNAETGAKAIRLHAPDIVFTDIKMPDADGLTMLAGLKSEFPHLQVTVLTGYRDFKYAQEAIRLGVTRLLLKPSRMNEIDEALTTMVEHLSQEGENRREQAADGEEQNAGSFIVRQAMEYIREHYSGKLTLQDLADHCYVSQWHLSKLLNKHTGKNFYELLNDTRIQTAKRLLADPGLKIGEICEMVGYTDAGHFSRVFKKIEGMTANEYRNSHLV